MRNASRWLIDPPVHAVALGALYAWKVDGIQTAGNLLQFWLWFLVIVACLIAAIPNKDLPAAVPPRQVILSTVNLTCWLVMIGALAAFGHFVLAGFLVWMLIVLRTNRARYDDAGNLKAKEPTNA